MSLAEGNPDRYKKEILALRRLEKAIEHDPKISLARADASKTKVRALIHALAELVSASGSVITPAEIQQLPKRRGSSSASRAFRTRLKPSKQQKSA